MAFEAYKNLSRKTKTFIWVILLLLILLITLFIYLRFREQPTAPLPPLTQEAVTPQPSVLPPQTQNAGLIADVVELNGPDENVDEESRDELLFFASSFVERYGSYSNQTNFKNLDDLDSFMTDSFRDFTETLKTDLRRERGDFDTYYGIETKVISTEIQDFTDTGSTVLLKTQRQEFDNTITDPKVFYQDIRLELVKEAAGWKVQGAFWQ